jgi:carbon-monoxide dehydrogenase large subunit
MPGVRAVITARDIEGDIPTIPFRRPNPTIGPYAQPVIARDKVRYYGEPVAMVLADSAEVAEDALAAIMLDIEALPPVIEREAAMSDKVLLFEDVKTNTPTVFNADKGDAEAAFAAADYVIRDQFYTQRQTALPMETRGLLAEWDAKLGKLSVSGAAKLPFFNRKAMATMMNLPEEAVDYIELDVGGGFGARGEFYPEDYLVAFGARKFGHPVKWIEDRREHLMAIGHSRECASDVELAFRKDGVILGMRGSLYINVGAYVRPNGMTPVRNAAQFMSGPYRVPAIHLDAYAFVSNKTPAGTYRGPGRYEGCFFIERLMDQAAAGLGIDRLELRRRNLITHAEMPYPLATVLPSDGRAETQCDSGHHLEPFELVVKDSNWAEKAALQGQLIDGRYHGIAIASFIEGGASGPQENVRLELHADGKVGLYAGSSAIGQGLETILSQIAADALELPMERIEVFHGSTNILKEGWGSFGSRSTVMGGSAVLDGAKKFLAAFRVHAAVKLGVTIEDVTISECVARTADGRSVPLVEVAKDGINVDGSFKNQTPTYTYGTSFAHVAVDAGTGHVEVIDYVVADDVGRIINSMTLHGQVMGAAVQGFGSVFSEELVYNDEGQLMVGSLADYLVPLASDYPVVRCHSLESYPSPTNPLGAKGAGEGGIIPVGGVVANAVANALSSFGVKPNVLPLSPSRVWEMIEDARARV